MSEVSECDQNADIEMPANDSIEFPPYPDPESTDFEDDIIEDERNYYLNKYKDLNKIVNERLHCTACDRHLGCSVKNESRMRSHPMLRTLMCHTCHTFYNSGEFEKGDDGSELYCRWCGQGGQVYCCADCQHVFCAKCIKRNLGSAKIKEIESLDDWKCFKCNPQSLWDHRALCWALLRFVDLRNKIAYKTEDADLKESYNKCIAIDSSTCCIDKRRRSIAGVKRKRDIKKEKKEEIKKEKKEEVKKEKKDDIQKEIKNTTSALISKIPPTIQVKKFASINLEDRNELKGRKGSYSPKSKTHVMKNPIAIAPFIKPISLFPSQPKKFRVREEFRYQSPNPILQGSLERNQKMISYTPRMIRPKPPLISHPPFNGFNPMAMNSGDNINLSLESLTQGLDMAAAVASVSMDNDDVVCTPDFPLDSCEDFDDNEDDDVQCITPGPVATPTPAPKPTNVTINKVSKIPDLSPENIIQMTDNDVTVNALTGGLKFRVDPQTLSANKMYRLPDGRIFAINPNPAMPGGYSATIVAVSDNATINMKSTSKAPTYSAKVCPVPAKNIATPPPLAKISRISRNPSRQATSHRNTKIPKASDTETRKVDVDVPVEWYRYNLIDAVDCLEYSLKRLRKLKKEATTMFLRSRTTEEIRTLHRTLDRVLQTSSTRFSECRINLNQGLKQYIVNKSDENQISDDDDDVEILNEHENDDPIFIDENSFDSNDATKNESQGIDLIDTSDPNDSAEKEAECSLISNEKKAECSLISNETIVSTNGSLDVNATDDDACGSKSFSDIMCAEDYSKDGSNDGRNFDLLDATINKSSKNNIIDNESEMSVDKNAEAETCDSVDKLDVDPVDKLDIEDKSKETSKDTNEVDKNNIFKDHNDDFNKEKTEINKDHDKKQEEVVDTTNKANEKKSEEIKKTDDTNEEKVSLSDDPEENNECNEENKLLQENTENELQDGKSNIPDADMSDKLIESLLCDDSLDVQEPQKDACLISDVVALDDDSKAQKDFSSKTDVIT